MEESSRGAVVHESSPGRLDEHVARERGAARQPARRPARAAALGLHRRPAYEAEPDRAFPSIYLIQGHTGQLDMWRNRSAFRPNVPELVDAPLRRGGCPAGARRLRRRVDVVRRLAVPRLAGRRAATTRTSATRSSRSSTRATGRSPRRGTAASPASRAAATARWSTPMLRPDLFGGLATHAGDALFEALLPAGLPRGGARAARRVRRLVRRVLGGLPLATGVHEAHRLRAPQHVRDGRVLLGERRRLRRPAVRHRDREAARRRVGALARVGSGPHGATRHADALRGLRAIYIDAGKRDQYFLDLGAEAFRRALERSASPTSSSSCSTGRTLDRVPLPARDPLSRRAAPVARSARRRAPKNRQVKSLLRRR